MDEQCLADSPEKLTNKQTKNNQTIVSSLSKLQKKNFKKKGKNKKKTFEAAQL